MLTKGSTDQDVDRSLGVFFTSFGAATATNNTLRILSACLAVVSCFEGAVINKLGNTIANQRPLIVRSDALGKAVPIGYEWDYKPQSNEVKYFVLQFCNYFFTRTHDARLPITYSRAYAFLAPDFFRKQLAYDQQTHWLPAYLQSADPDVRITVDNILVRNLDHAPYEVTTILREQFLGQNGAPAKPEEKHEVTLHFTFAQKVPNEFVPINPLGLLISSVQDDKSFQ